MSEHIHMTTEEIWENLYAVHRELEDHIETLENHINILKAKVFGDNSWASIETLCDEGD